MRFQYDMNTQETYPSDFILNERPVQCRHCTRVVEPEQGAPVTVTERWLDWDNPDPDAQGNYQESSYQEWYCTAQVDCARAVIAQGIDASPAALANILELGAEHIDVEAVAQARALLQEQARYRREARTLLADIENAALHDDNSPRVGW